MGKFRRALMWLALILIILLILLSIYGAFVSAGRAKGFFNSLPLSVYWSAFALILIVGVAVFRRLVRVPALLLVHIGCCFILWGSMWASESGHEIQKALSGIDRIVKGRMVIFEGQSEKVVALENRAVMKELPFSIKLKDFRVEHYEPEYLYVETRKGKRWKIPVEINTEFLLGPELGTVAILRRFENFKMRIDGEKRTALDAVEPGYNPALQVQLRDPNGGIVTRYVFERFPGHSHPGDRFVLSYRRVISDYISEVEVIEDRRVASAKKIEVNHPLHFGGYHFYQHKYDDEAHRYTILEVVSDSGLNFVYAGYVMLCIGVFWHLWLRERFGSGLKLKRG